MGWINTYINYTKPQQSPTFFHTWTAFAVIAAALRRRVWINFDYYSIFPNLYTILVSDSGVGNKSTAIKIGGENILAKANIPDFAIMRGTLTIPYLIEWMVRTQNSNPDKFAEVTILCDEFKVFARGAYADSGLIEGLTKLYDCGPFEYRLKNSPISVVDKPCVNIIAASTPEWLAVGSAADFIGGGFSSRIIPAAILKDERIVPRPKMTQTEKALEKMLINDLSIIGALAGQFLITQKAEQYYDDWYTVRIKTQNPDLRMRGYYAKKHTLVWKLAMILSLNINDDLVITEDHIEAALKLLGKLELTIPFAFQGVAWGEQAKMQEKVMIEIHKRKEVVYSELLQSVHHLMGTTELQQILQTLKDEEKIDSKKVSTGGKQKTIIFLKEDKP